MKKKNVYPDWVEKYRGKGKTIRKVRDGYGLYECTSIYVPGNKYPKSVQTYLGMVTEKDGFIPKRVIEDINGINIEYGLSNFIYINFKRELMRSSYRGNDLLIRLGIIYYLFGDINETFIRSSYLAYDYMNELIDRYNAGVNISRLKVIANKIDKLLIEKISDDKDRNILIKLLWLTTIKEKQKPDDLNYHDEVKRIIDKYKLKL